jgi:hypothetical protein
MSDPIVRHLVIAGLLAATGLAALAIILPVLP